MSRPACLLLACLLTGAAALVQAAAPRLPSQYHATVILTRQALDDPFDLPLWEEVGILSLCDLWHVPTFSANLLSTFTYQSVAGICVECSQVLLY